MALPAPIFVGFFVKATQTNPEWLKVPSVQEICSVSECISPAPSNWIQRWQHNALGFYDSEPIALSIIEGNPQRYDLYAYELFPVRCQDGSAETFAIDLAIGSIPPDYAFLGYDIVTRSSSDFFECSPLSCNYAAQDNPVNVYCLLDDEDQAYQAMLEMSKPGSRVEPGPYYLFKVYRKTRG